MKKNNKTKMILLTSICSLTVSCGMFKKESKDEDEGGDSGKELTTEEKKAQVDSAEGYETAFAPGSLALTFPASLSSVNGSSLRLQGGEAGQESMGFMRLREAVEDIKYQQRDLERNKNMADYIVSQNENCTVTDGIAEDCNIKDACGEVTSGMVKDILEEMSEEEAKMMKEGIAEMVGHEICFAELDVKKLVDDPSGFVQQVTLKMDENNATVLLWSKGGNKVKISNKFEHSFDDMIMADDGTAPPAHLTESGDKTQGTESLEINQEKKTYIVKRNITDTFNGVTSKMEQVFNAKALAEKLTANGIELSGSFKWSDDNNMSFTSNIEGRADDKGGFLRETLVDTMQEIVVSGTTMTGSCDAESHYEIFRGDADFAALDEFNMWQYSVGGLWCGQEATASVDQLFMHRSVPDPTKLKFAKVDWKEDGSVAIAEATGISITALEMQPVNNFNCFESLFDAAGKTTSERHAMKKCSEVTESDWSGNLAAGGDYFVDEGAVDVSEVRVSVSGISDKSLKDLAGMGEGDYPPFVHIVRKNDKVDFLTLELWSEAFHQEKIGDIVPMDPEAGASADKLSYQVHFWGNEDQIADAELYVEYFDADGGLSLKKVTGATLSVIED